METPAGHSLDRGLWATQVLTLASTAMSERPLHRLGSCPCAEGERIERPRDSRPDLRLATGCLTTLGQPSNVPQEGSDPHVLADTDS
jgi:hypothetical protein